MSRTALGFWVMVAAGVAVTYLFVTVFHIPGG